MKISLFENFEILSVRIDLNFVSSRLIVMIRCTSLRVRKSVAIIIINELCLVNSPHGNWSSHSTSDTSHAVISGPFSFILLC